MTDPRIIFVGAPETAAADFEARARADFPGIDLYCTNDRLDAQVRADSAEALVGHHFQFDGAVVQAAPKLRWVQSLTTGTTHLVMSLLEFMQRLAALLPRRTILPNGLRRHSLSDCFAAMNSAP